MFKHKKILALAAVLTLLFSSFPALAQNIPAGQWVTSPQDGQYRMMLGKDGAFIFTIDDPAAAKDIHPDTDTGTYAIGEDILTMMQIAGGSTKATEFSYRLDANTLTLNPDTNDAMVFSLKPYSLPTGLAGQWEGKDENGAFIFTFHEDSSFDAAYRDGRQIASGLYLPVSSRILIAFDDGNHMEMTYQLSGDALDLQDTATGEQFSTTRAGAMPVKAAAYENKDLGVALDVDSAITINDTFDNEGNVYLFVTGEHIPYVMIRRYEPQDVSEFISLFTASMQENYQDDQFTAGPAFKDQVGDRPVEAILYSYVIQGNSISDTRVFFIENGWLYMFVKKENLTTQEYAGELLEHAILNFKAIGPAYGETAEVPKPQTASPAAPQTNVPASQQPAAPPTAAPIAPAAETTETPSGQAAQASTLTGVWKMENDSETWLVTLDPGGKVTLNQKNEQESEEIQGVWLSDDTRITILLSDGSTQSSRYILMGDTLLLANEDMSNPITLQRVSD